MTTIGGRKMEIKRSDAWRLYYRNRQYLKHLSDVELRQRFQDVSLNVFFLTDEGQIGFVNVLERNPAWLELWTHLHEEYGRRVGGLPPGLLDASSFFGFRDPVLMKRVADLCSATKFTKGEQLAKFGKRKYLRPMFESGALRILPASSYSDPSLNPAIRDDELSIYSQKPPGEILLNVVDHKTGKLKAAGIPIDGIIRKRINTDYFVYCMSQSLTPRLFLDFEADACLIVHDLEKFTDLFKIAFRSALHDYSFGATFAKYLDPVLDDIFSASPESAKHFRYSYQSELRFIWFPPTPILKLDPVHITLGSLSEVCSYIELPA